MKVGRMSEQSYPMKGREAPPRLSPLLSTSLSRVQCVGPFSVSTLIWRLVVPPDPISLPDLPPSGRPRPLPTTSGEISEFTNTSRTTRSLLLRSGSPSLLSYSRIDFRSRNLGFSVERDGE